MHILHVVGARPNFMKAAPVLAALAEALEKRHPYRSAVWSCEAEQPLAVSAPKSR